MILSLSKAKVGQICLQPIIKDWEGFLFFVFCFGGGWGQNELYEQEAYAACNAVSNKILYL